MAGELLPPVPTQPDTVSNSWQPLLDQNTMSFYGMNQVTLTNWDETTTAPAVAQGSAIDIDGSVARFPTEEPIGGAPLDGVVWLKFIVVSQDVTAEWTNESPTWYADKAGWYNVAGERYSGHYCTLAAGDYSDKFKVRNEIRGNVLSLGYLGLDVSDKLNSDELECQTLTIINSNESSVNLNVGQNYTTPNGIWYYYHSSGSVQMSVYINGGWRPYAQTDPSDVGFVISDGSNMRLTNLSSITITLNFRKLL